MKPLHTFIRGAFRCLLPSLAALSPLAVQGDDNDLRSIPSGLAHYWNLNEANIPEGDGSTTFDRAGPADGVFEGRAAFELLDSAIGGSFVAIDNTAGSGVNVGLGGFDQTANGITVEAVLFLLWSGEDGDYDEIFRKDDGGDRILFGFQNDTFGGGANPPVDPGPVLSFGLNVGGYGELDMPLDGSNEAGVTLESLKDGQFHHVAATYDTASGEKAIWVDGVKAWSVMFAAGTSPVTGGSTPAYIGNLQGGAEPFTGGIDEVAIWNRALTAEEVATHAQNVSDGKRNPYIPPPDVAKGDYANAVIADTPVAYWRLGDASASIGEAVDATGNGNTGLGEDGTLAFVTDSLVPPDTDGSVSLNADRFLVEGFDKADTGFTVELWAQIDAATGGFANLVGDGDGGLNFMLMLYLTPSGQVRPHVQTDAGFGSLDSIRRIDDGILHHIVSTWDEESGEMILYIDGAPAETRASAGTFPTTGTAINDENPIFIGRDNREAGWDGLIDEVAIYDYALSPERVRAHFDLVDTPEPDPDEDLPDPGDLIGAPSGLTHLYDFNEANRQLEGFTLNFAYDRLGSANGRFEAGAGRTDGVIGRGAATFDNAPGAAVHVGADGFETTTGISIEAVIVSEWSGDGGDYEEIFRKEDGGNRILFSFQNDAFGGGANPAVDPGPVLSFGLNIGGYGELDMPLDGTNDEGITLEDLTDGNPHLVVATYDSVSGEKAIWVDGMKAWKVDLAAGTEIVSGGGAEATIGNVGPGGGEPFTGTIDEFGFWDRALTGEEIAEHYESVASGRAMPYFPRPEAEGAYADHVLQDNPIGYWRLDDPGPTAFDLSGNSNDGEERSEGAVDWGATSLLAFDPNTSAGMIGEGIIVPGFEKVGLAGFSVEFIMQIEQAELGGFTNLVGDGTGGLNFMLMVYSTASGNIRPHYQTTDSFYSQDTVESYADGKPHHVVSVWNAQTGEAVIYVDGEAVEATPSAGSFPTTGEAIFTGNPLYIGRDDREFGFNGFLDEVAIYDHPLTAERVSAHYIASVSEEPIDPEPGDSEFAVTEIMFDATNDELRLAWNSAAGATYVVEISTDLVAWVEAASWIESAGATTSITENISPFLAAEATHAYVRVKVSE